MNHIDRRRHDLARIVTVTLAAPVYYSIATALLLLFVKSEGPTGYMLAVLVTVLPTLFGIVAAAPSEARAWSLDKLPLLNCLHGGALWQIRKKEEVLTITMFTSVIVCMLLALHAGDRAGWIGSRPLEVVVGVQLGLAAVGGLASALAYRAFVRTFNRSRALILDSSPTT